MAYLQSKWKLKPVNLVPDYKDHFLGEGGQTSDTRYCLVASIEGQPDTYRMMSTPFKCQYYLGDHIWASEEKVNVTIHGYPADGINNPVPEIIRLMVMRAHPATPLLCQLVNKALRRKLITNVYKLAADVEHVCKGHRQIAQADNTLVIEFAKEVRTCVPFLNFITWMCRQELTEATTLWEMFHTMNVPGSGDRAVRNAVKSEKALHTILR